jgi:hypothetical protein
VDVVHVVEVSGTGTHSGWFCQRVEWNSIEWVVSVGPVDYNSVIEINGMQPRMEDTSQTPGSTALAVTTLFKDVNGQYYIDYPRLNNSDVFTFPSAVGCVSGQPQFTATTTIKGIVDNFTAFPNISVRFEAQ